MLVQENSMSNVKMMEGNWLPHPEEKIFLDQLYLFMERRGSPICKVPNLGFKKSECWLRIPLLTVLSCFYKFNLNYLSVMVLICLQSISS